MSYTNKALLWNLTELRQDDPRSYLELIVLNVTLDKPQAIKYRNDTVYVISEEQYKKLQSI